MNAKEKETEIIKVAKLFAELPKEKRARVLSEIPDDNELKPILAALAEKHITSSREELA